MMYEKLYSLLDLSDQYDAFLFDIWGVLTDINPLDKEAVERVNYIIRNKSVRIVSNSPRLPDTVYHRLRKDVGLCIDSDMIITSGMATRSYLKGYSGMIYHLGEDHNHEILSGLEVNTTHDLREAKILLLTVRREFHQKDDPAVLDVLAEAARLNIPAVCANPDMHLVSSDGTCYCAGYYAQQYIKKYGGMVKHCGKPDSEIFQIAFDELNHIPRKKFIMIGDTFETDILGAHNVGIDSALVLTGNMRQLLNQYSRLNTEFLGDAEQLQVAREVCAQREIRPTYMLSI